MTYRLLHKFVSLLVLMVLFLIPEMLTYAQKPIWMEMSGNSERPKSSMSTDEELFIKSLTEHFIAQINKLRWEMGFYGQIDMYRGMLYEVGEDEREQ